MLSKRTAGTLGLALSLVPALVGLVASVMLAVDYSRPAPVFCTENLGCAALRQTAYAAWLGIPTPYIGVAGFLSLAVVTLVNAASWRALQIALGAVAGLMGLFLLVVQVRLGDYCPFCVVADLSGVACALASTVRLWMAGGEGAPRLAVGVGAVLLAGAAVVPLAVGTIANPVPKVIRDEMAATPAGQITVVDFVDFECPYCRETNAAFRPVLETRRAKVRLVRRQVPLASHPHAMDAARAACCGERLGKGDAMAEALFTAPVEELTPEGCERIAQRLGLSLDAYRACIADPATSASIERDRAEFKATGGRGLPTIWINGEVLKGAQTSEELAAALDRASARIKRGG
jgi:protein-disulfide isomerase